MKNGTYDRKSLYSLPELKRRGWTDAAIRKFLPEPDDTRPNPVYSSAGAPMRFYLISRVEAIEQTPEWQAWKAGKRSSTKALTTKVKKLLRAVEQIEINVPSLSPEDLRDRAIQDFNAGRREGQEPADASAPPGFLVRIQVNYLRHVCTSYHQHLYKIKGPGAHEARIILRRKIYAAIPCAYPHLAEECRRQEADRSAKERSAQSDAVAEIALFLDDEEDYDINGEDDEGDDDKD